MQLCLGLILALATPAALGLDNEVEFAHTTHHNDPARLTPPQVVVQQAGPKRVADTGGVDQVTGMAGCQPLLCRASHQYMPRSPRLSTTCRTP